MSRAELKTLQIRIPKFDLYKFVTLYWNGKQHPTKVVARWYELDKDSWWYKVSGDEHFYSEQQIER